MNIEGFSVHNYLQTRIKDDSFDVELISQFELCLQFFDNAFNFCVVDTRTQRCLLLESYEIPILPHRSFIDHLGFIFEDHHFLMAGFWKTVKISTGNKFFSFIPSSLYEPTASEHYLNCHTTFNPDIHSVYQYKHDLPDSVNVFAANTSLINKIRSFYSENIVKVVHQSSCLIHGVNQDQHSMSLKTMYLTLHKNTFTLVIKNENTLQYCNTFSFSSSNELIYYLMFVASTFNINKKTTKIILFGDIEKDSEEYLKITQYFKFVAFGEKPSYLKFGYVFDEIPDHQFFDLFSIYLS